MGGGIGIGFFELIIIGVAGLALLGLVGGIIAATVMASSSRDREGR
jgi:hypothetical protein